MNRRDALRYFALAAGGSFGARMAQAAMTMDEHMHGAAALRKAAERPVVKSLLNADQQQMLSALTDLIIPVTDTPGAVQAGVPAFIDQIFSSWFTNAERASFLQGFAALDTFCTTKYAHTFAECDQVQRIAALSDADVRSRDFKPGPMDTVADSLGGSTPFFVRLKALTVLGYYTSEIGATQELSYNPVPAAYDGDYDFAKTGRQWSS